MNRKKNNFKSLLAYGNYLLHSVSRYRVHSPFVFDLIEKVFRDPVTIVTGSARIEQLRERLKNDPTLILKTDFGQSGKLNPSYNISVGKLAKSSTSPAFKAQLIAKLINYFAPDHILELGTSLGLTTAYMSIAAPEASITTLEGAPQIADLARKNFSSLRCNNINVIEGDFKSTLHDCIASLPHLDFVYFDGDHSYGSTIEYYRICLEKSGNDTVFVFDDIHWSDEMERAWDFIVNHNKATVTIDLFHLGLVFFRKELSKQHFIIRDYHGF